jgi:hypothetical protein
VRTPRRQWRVDVKDWRSAAQLAAVLLATRTGDPSDPSQASGTDTIIVPDHRADQLPVLRERLDGVYQVLSRREFAAAVRAAARPVR